MEESVQMLVQGIKCDNPDCDFIDMDVKMEDYPKWVNKPCPKCNSNLLTENDYAIVKYLSSLKDLINVNVPIEQTGENKKVSIQFELNGTGELKISEPLSLHK